VADVQAASKAQEQARRALYEAAGRECGFAKPAYVPVKTPNKY